MRNIKLTSVTLKKRDFKEKDRIITVISRTFGKYDLIAKGVQKHNKNSGISEPLSYGTVIVSNLKNLGTVTSCDLKESFPYIHSSLNVLSHAFYILELCDKCTAYAQECDDIFEILLASLIMLEGKSDPETAIRFFEHKLINILGYRINTDTCLICHKPLNGTIYYNAELGGFCCQRCNYLADPSAVFPFAILSYIKVFDRYPIKKIKDMTFSAPVNEDLSRLYKKHLLWRIDRNINSLNFIIKQKKDTEEINDKQ